jgi:hypothetical protein
LKPLPNRRALCFIEDSYSNRRILTSPAVG